MDFTSLPRRLSHRIEYTTKYKKMPAVGLAKGNCYVNKVWLHFVMVFRCLVRKTGCGLMKISLKDNPEPDKITGNWYNNRQPPQ